MIRAHIPTPEPPGPAQAPPIDDPKPRPAEPPVKDPPPDERRAKGR